MGRKIYCDIPTDELIRLYIDENRTLEEMGEIMGMKSTITVSKCLLARGIDTNKNQRRAKQSRCGMTDADFEQYLKTEYKKGRSMNDISKSLGITPSAVRKYFVKYGIPRRNNAGYSSIDATFAANWKGGRRVASNGYVEIKVPNYPNLNKRGYVYEHQYVVEQAIGRPLQTGEVIHHIDGNKQNNRLDNLMLLTNSDHAKLHAIIRHSKHLMKRGDDSDG